MDGSELTTQDLADTLAYWKSRAIRAEKLLQGYIDRELGNTLRGTTQANAAAVDSYCTDCGGKPGDHAEDCTQGDLAIRVVPDGYQTTGTALRIGRSIAKQLAAECRALKGTGLITPGYWIQENREAVALMLDAFAERSTDNDVLASAYLELGGSIAEIDRVTVDVAASQKLPRAVDDLLRRVAAAIRKGRG